MTVNRESQRPTRDGDPTQYHIPDQAPQYIEHEDTPQKPNRLRRAVGMFAAGAVLVGGGAVIGEKVVASHNPEAGKAGDRPTASAPAVPGQTHEATPSATPTQTPETSVDTSNWNPGNIPLVINGRVYNGVEAAAQALELHASSPQEAAKKFADLLTEWVNFGDNQQSQSLYAGYDGKVAPGSKGVGAVIADTDIDNNVFGKVFRADPNSPSGGTDQQLNTEFITATGQQRLTTEQNYQESTGSASGGEAYRLSFTMEDVTCNEVPASGGAYACDATYTMHDNMAKTGIPEHRKKTGLPEPTSKDGQRLKLGFTVVQDAPGNYVFRGMTANTPEWAQG